MFDLLKLPVKSLLTCIKRTLQHILSTNNLIPYVPFTLLNKMIKYNPILNKNLLLWTLIIIFPRVPRCSVSCCYVISLSFLCCVARLLMYIFLFFSHLTHCANDKKISRHITWQNVQSHKSVFENESTYNTNTHRD